MTELIDSHVSKDQVERAVKALSSYIQNSRAEEDERLLLGAKEDFVWLVVATKKMTPQNTLKPTKISLLHPVLDPRRNPVCLLTKDPQREYKDLLISKKINFISRVVGVQKLRGKFKPFESRRQLVRDYGLFLADERIIPLLPSLLGKIFFDAKKHPIPVSLKKRDLRAELETAICSTYMHKNRGTCISVKIAAASSSEKQILENFAVALPTIIANVSGEWDNVQSLHIKTSQSTSLPIWTSPQLGFNTTSPAGLVPAQVKRQDDQRTESTEQRNEKHGVEGVGDLISIGENDVAPGREATKLANEDQSISPSSSPSSTKLREAVAVTKKQKGSRLLRKKQRILGQKGKIENRGPKRIIVGGRHV